MEIVESTWDAWTFMADPGTHADEHDWPKRIIAFIITFVGKIQLLLQSQFFPDPPYCC